jgi:hypothetical protein
VSLSGSYNRTGIFADGTSYPGNGGLDGDGTAYSGALLASPVKWGGQVFNLGPVGAADVISADGRTIALPSGASAQLMFLATAVNGNQAGLTFTVNYADRSSASFVQSFSDWLTPQDYAGESIAATTAYRDTNGSREQSAPFNLYGYAESLNGGKTVVSLTLPNDPNLEILAIDLVGGNGNNSNASVKADAATPGSLAASGGNQDAVIASGTDSLPARGTVDNNAAAPVAPNESQAGSAGATASAPLVTQDLPPEMRQLLQGQPKNPDV